MFTIAFSIFWSGFLLLVSLLVGVAGSFPDVLKYLLPFWIAGIMITVFGTKLGSREARRKLEEIIVR